MTATADRERLAERFAFAGTYALLLYLPARQRVGIGRLGAHQFVRGWYIYLGSARGPGGVAARVGHHLGGQGRPRWHLDYLRPWTRPRGLWAAACAREHQWAALLGGLPAARIPLARFGASDCRCPGHLVYFPRRPRLKTIKSALQSQFPHDPPVKMITL